MENKKYDPDKIYMRVGNSNNDEWIPVPQVVHVKDFEKLIDIMRDFIVKVFTNDCYMDLENTQQFIKELGELKEKIRVK